MNDENTIMKLSALATILGAERGIAMYELNSFLKGKEYKNLKVADIKVEDAFYGVHISSLVDDHLLSCHVWVAKSLGACPINISYRDKSISLTFAETVAFGSMMEKLGIKDTDKDSEFSKVMNEQISRVSDHFSKIEGDVIAKYIEDNNIPVE